jgi:ParB-like chromosome segregation protein Spo0J
MRLREHPAIKPGRNDILDCDPRKIKIQDGYNVRDLTTKEARAELDELKASVKQNGIITPLKVRFDGKDIWLVEGHRRLMVALELIDEHKQSGGTDGLKIETIPIFPEARGTSEVDRDFGLETSNSGMRLKPLELANLIYRLKEVRGVPLPEIANRLGKTLQSVKTTLALRAMPEAAKQNVRDGKMSATLAAKLQKEDPAFVEKLHKDNEEENREVGVGVRPKRITPKKVEKAKEAAKPKEEPKAPEPPKEGVAPATPPEVLAERAAEQVAIDTAPEASAALSSALAATQEHEAAQSGHSPLSDEAPPQEQQQDRQREVVQIARRPNNRVDELLLEFISVDQPTLAGMYARLVKESDEARAEGEQGLARWHLFKAADHIGHSRFADDWEQAKANSELEQVA